MEIIQTYPWPSNLSEALQLQERLKNKIITEGNLDNIDSIAGVETSYDLDINKVYAGISLYSFPDLENIENATASAEIDFEYKPGLIAFREGPVILKAFSRLINRPDVLIFSAHGIAHPRNIGMASHIGLILNQPTIGCARKRLCGQYSEPGNKCGQSEKLYMHNKEIGLVYRSRDGVNPLFISPGHLCSVSRSSQIVISCLKRYRMPEPLRGAHRAASKEKRRNQKLSREVKG